MGRGLCLRPEPRSHIHSFIFSHSGRLTEREMHSLTTLALLAIVAVALAQSYEDDQSTEKRASMRNALVRFGRAGGMRNALVRFGKRSAAYEEMAAPSTQDKRNGAPQPFVRFGRSGQLEHMHDILSTLQRLQLANTD